MMMRKRVAAAAVVLSMALVAGCEVVVLGAAMGGGALIATDRRNSDVILADERIEWSAQQRLRESGRWEQLNVNSTSYNRIVLLSGQAADEATKQFAERIVSEIPGVRGVSNELTVAPFSNFGARSGDSFVTTQVKARMVGADGFNPAHVKVVTEAGVVYLLGLVTEREGDAAAKVAAGTAGVTKVIKYFEYITDPTGAVDRK